MRKMEIYREEIDRSIGGKRGKFKWKNEKIGENFKNFKVLLADLAY